MLRHPAIAAARGGQRARSAATELIWRDSPEGRLAAAGLVLEEARRGDSPGVPRLLRSMPEAARPWVPGTPLSLPEPHPEEATAPLVPLAAFHGRRSTLSLAPDTSPLIEVTLLAGKLRAVAAERPVARLVLHGPTGPLLALARRLAADLPLTPPVASLAEEGRALARGEAAPRPRRRGPPDLGGAATVEAALLAATGHLLQVMLHQAPLCRAELGPEGVHQMRVGLRRLRSVLKAFRRAHGGVPAVRGFDAGLRDLAQALGAARDLDVFLGGLGAQVAAALPGDRRIAALLRALGGRRAAAYAALGEALEAPAFRHLLLDGLALLLHRPWREPAEGEDPAAAAERRALLDEPLPVFAARMLDKRWHRLCERGEEIAALDAEALHELRLEAKRLRYVAELFAPLWRGKASRRFLKRLAALQETLGAANDAMVARGLVAGLGGSVPAWAVGAVEGFAVAAAGDARGPALSAWEDLRDTAVFWSDL